MKPNKEEQVYQPYTFEIHQDRFGKPYLKKVYRKRNLLEEGRGRWMPIGRAMDTGIERVLMINREVGGLVCLPDETGEFRALVLTD